MSALSRPMRGWQGWLDRRLDSTLPKDPVWRHGLKIRVFRMIAILNILLGLYYFVFRYTEFHQYVGLVVCYTPFAGQDLFLHRYATVHLYDVAPTLSHCA